MNVNVLISLVHALCDLLCGLSCTELEDAIGRLNRVSPIPLVGFYKEVVRPPRKHCDSITHGPSSSHKSTNLFSSSRVKLRCLSVRVVGRCFINFTCLRYFFSCAITIHNRFHKTFVEEWRSPCVHDMTHEDAVATDAENGNEMKPRRLQREPWLLSPHCFVSMSSWSRHSYLIYSQVVFFEFTW